MKVFNLTDVPTPLLTQRNLVSHTFAVGKTLLAPGDSADVADDEVARVKGSLQELIANGAAAVDRLPETYKAARDKQRRAGKAPDSAQQAAAPVIAKASTAPAETRSPADKTADPETKVTNTEDPSRARKSESPARPDIIDQKSKTKSS